MPLIVGGGPAGSAAAIGLARAVRDVTIIERTEHPADMLCGGFLSWNTMRLLDRCDVDPLALGGHSINRARLFAGDRCADLALPAPACGLSRLRLDQALLMEARRSGAEIKRGLSARLIENGAVRLSDGTVERPDKLILATGKHDVRGARRQAYDKEALSMGLRWRFPASAALAAILDDAIELHLFDHGYAGLMLQEDGAANLCVAVRMKAFAKTGQTPDSVLAHMLESSTALTERLGGEALGPAQAVANVPYGWRAKGDSQGLYRVGDQIGVIPSLAGEGVGIALLSGMVAADAVIRGENASRYLARTSRRIARPITVAANLWQAAERPTLARNALPLIAKLPGVAGMAMRWTRV